MATMEMSRLRKIPADENMAVNRGKLNQTKAPLEMKRAALGDLASNKMHNKSKLPILKSELAKARPPLKPLSTTECKIAPSKENQALSSTVSTTESKTALKENQAPLSIQNVSKPVNTLVDRTKGLKIGVVKKNVKQVAADVSKENDVSKTGRPFGVKDIDSKDPSNPFLLAAYVKDIYCYMRKLEQTHPIRENYLKDRNITPKMRSILIDWLVEVQQEYKLLPETLHIAVGILDTYLQNKSEVSRHHMQLIGVTALFLASKYEEIYVPSVEELVYISASAFRKDDLYEMERRMFQTVNYDLSRPVSLSFLRRYSKAAHAEAIQHNFAKYFLELALVEYTLCHVNPSLVAAAALYLALFVTGSQDIADKGLWTPTLEFYSEYKFTEIKPVVKILAKLAFNAKNSEYTAVYQKYAKPRFVKVSENNVLYSNRVRVLASLK